MWNIEYSYYEGLWRKCDMDAFTSTLVTARQHNARVPWCFFIMCCFGALSLFFSLSLSFHFFLPSCFFHIIPAFLFFCTSDNSRFLTVTCVPRYGARGESDAVGWNRSQNTLSLDELPGGKLMHAGLLPSLFSEMLSGIIDARRAVSPSQRWVYLK